MKRNLYTLSSSLWKLNGDHITSEIMSVWAAKVTFLLFNAAALQLIPLLFLASYYDLPGLCIVSFVHKCCIRLFLYGPNFLLLSN